MSIPVRISDQVHYVRRWRAALAALTGRPVPTLCRQHQLRQADSPQGELCVPCARRAGEPSL